MVKKSTPVILMTSGGMDSTTLAYWLLNKGIEFIPLFFNYGQHCKETELNTLRQVLPEKYKSRIKVLDISCVFENSESLLIKEADLWNEEVSHEDLYVPYRSLLLLTTAAAFAQSGGINTIYSGFINSNHAKEIDCSSEFFNKLEGIFSNYGGIKMAMPFRYMSKYEVAKIGLELKVPIANTFSCQVFSDIPCGACPNCVDRLEAFKKL